MPYASIINIRIYNSIGEIVYKLDNKYHQAGSYSFIWTPNNLPSGIYYIQLKTDNIIINKKTKLICQYFTASKVTFHSQQ